MPTILAAEPATASGVLGLSWLLVALPLLGAAVLLLGGRRTDRFGHLLGTAMPAAAFVLGAIQFFAMLARAEDDRAVSTHLFSWVPAGGFQVDVSLLLDQLSMCFVLLITGVGTLIHVYSIGYMAHDADR
nr:NADH-quinone oxidoreductase subunit L [Propionibacteriales bacterium]